MDYNELHSSITGYIKAVITKRKTKSGTAKQSQTAAKLEGLTAAELETAVDKTLADHIAASNPHRDSAGDLDMYTKSEYDAKTKGGMVQGLTAVSTYGSLNWLPIPALGTFTSASHVTTGNGRFMPLQLEDDGVLSFIRNGTDGLQQRACYGYIKNRVVYYTEQPYTLSNGKQAKLVYQGGQDVVTGALADDTVGFIALREGTLNGAGHRFVQVPAAFLATLAVAEVVVAREYVYIISLPNATEWMNQGNAATLTIHSIPLDHFDGTTYTPDAVSFSTQTSVGGTAGDASSVTYLVSRVTFSDSIDAKECIWRSPGGDGVEIDDSQWVEKGRAYTVSAYNYDTKLIRIQIQAPVQWYRNTELESDIATITVEFNTVSTAINVNANHTPFTVSSTGNGSKGVRDEDSTLVLTPRGQESYYQCDNNTTYVVSVGDDIQVYEVTTANHGTLYERLERPFGAGASVKDPITFPRYFGSPIGDKLCTFLPVDNNYAIVTTHNESAEADHVLVKFNTSSSSSPMKNFTTVEGETNIGYTFGGARARCIDVGDKPSAGDLKPSISFVNGKDVGYYCAYFTPGVGDTRATQYTNTLTAKAKITIAASKLEALMDESLKQVGYGDADRKTYEVIVPDRTDVPAMMKVYACYHDTGVHIMRLHVINVSSRSGVVDTVSLGAVLDSDSIGEDQVFGISESPYDTTGRLGRVAILGTSDGFIVHWVSNHLFSTRTTSSGRDGDRRHECRFWLSTDQKLSSITSEFYGVNVPDEESFAVLPDQGFGAVKGIAYGTVLRFQLLCYGKSDFQKWTSDTSASAKKWRSYTLTGQRTTATSVFRVLGDTPVVFRGRSYTVPAYSVDLSKINSSYLNRTFVVLLNYDFTTANMTYMFDDSSPHSYRHMGIGTITTDSRGPASIDIYKTQRLDASYGPYTPSWTVSSSGMLGNFPNTKGDPSIVVKTTWSRT